MRNIVDAWVADLSGKNQNTYKFVLQLALLRFSSKESIAYRELADFFAKRYWDNVVPFKLRETTSLKQCPHFHKAVQEVANEHDIDGLFFDQAVKCVPEIGDQIIAKLSSNYKAILQNPISRLQRDAKGKTTGGGSPEGSGWLYSWSSHEEALIYNPEAREELVANKALLEKLTVLHYALFIEKYNQAPSIVNKLFNERGKRNISKMVRELIHSLDNGYCFYCEEAVGDSFDIDHFIPFAFIFDDPEWDLVLSCVDCNRGKGGKFEKLPKNPFLQKLIKRNAEIHAKDPEFFENFGDFNELQEHLSKTYQSCVNAGFQWWDRGNAKAKKSA